MACFKTNLLVKRIEDDLTLDSPFEHYTKIISAPNNPLDTVTSEDVEHSRSLCCPICNILIVHDVFLNFSLSKRKFVNHMKRHIEVLCSLCSATIGFNYFGTHTSTCRFLNGASSVCPICNSPLTERKPAKHFKEHVPHFGCPFPHCSMFLKYDMTKDHMKTHFNQIINSNPSSINAYAPQFDVPTQCRGPTTTIISTVQFQCNLCDQAMSEDSKAVRLHLYSHLLHECPICHAQNIDESQFDLHIKSCFQPNHLQCPVCTRNFAISDNISEHIHTEHCSKRYLCQGCQRSLTCFSLKNHPIECLKRSPSTLTVNQQHVLNAQIIDCVVCRRKIIKSTFSSHFSKHFLYTCLFCKNASLNFSDILNDVTVCTSRWLGTQLNPIVFNCPFCNVNVNSASFLTHIQDEHIHLCPLCNTVIAKKLLIHHGLMCTVNNLGRVSSAAQDNHQLTEPPLDPIDTISSLVDRTEVSDQHTCLYPASIDSPISDFICPFCDTKHSGNVDLISSHLLSCVKIPSDLHIVALPNLVGFRLN